MFFFRIVSVRAAEDGQDWKEALSDLWTGWTMPGSWGQDRSFCSLSGL